MPRGPILGAREAPPGTSPPLTRMKTAEIKTVVSMHQAARGALWQLCNNPRGQSKHLRRRR